MDNPFIGLDAATRELLFNVLEKLAQLASLQIVLVLSMLDDVPSFITHVVPVENGVVGEKWNVPPICGLFVNGMLFVLRQMPLLSVNCSSV